MDNNKKLQDWFINECSLKLEELNIKYEELGKFCNDNKAEIIDNYEQILDGMLNHQLWLGGVIDKYSDIIDSQAEVIELQRDFIKLQDETIKSLGGKDYSGRTDAE